MPRVPILVRRLSLLSLDRVARRIMGQRNAAIAAADATTANMLAHQQDLNNMNRGMGLLPNERANVLLVQDPFHERTVPPGWCLLPPGRRARR